MVVDLLIRHTPWRSLSNYPICRGGLKGLKHTTVAAVSVQTTRNSCRGSGTLGRVFGQVVFLVVATL